MSNTLSLLAAYIAGLAVAEKSLAAAERLARVNREWQQKDARIYAQRGFEAVQAMGLIDQLMAEADTRHRRVRSESSPRDVGRPELPVRA
jgi:hypothetical protein